MCRIILLFVLCYHALSQPVDNERANWEARGSSECCPCPGISGAAALAKGGSLVREGLDDCPCKPRGADSEGASSLFFPSALRPDGPDVRPSDPREDGRNLLEPEVNLATSMLETLREATEEEYRDALVHEAGTNNISTEQCNTETILCNVSSQEQVINIFEDSLTDSSNNIVSTLESIEKYEPTKNIQNILMNTQSLQNDPAEVENGDITATKTLEGNNTAPTISDTLTQFRENVVKSLKNVKLPSEKSELFQMSPDEDNTNVINNREKTISDNLNSSFVNNEINNISVASNTETSSNIEDRLSVTDISMNDLQNMSDKLLLSNSRNQDDVKNTLRINENDDKLSKNKLNLVNMKLDEKNISEHIEQNACQTDSENKNDNVIEAKTPESAAQDTSRKEMDTGSSDTIIKTLPGILDSLNPNLKLRSPLLDDMVLHPPSDPLNLLGKPFENVLNLNKNLPTLDDIRERLSNIFNTNEESSEDYTSSLEADFTNDSPVEIMTTASTRSSQKELPLLRPLEDFNNNIIKTKSKIMLPFDDLSKKQKLQLNPYRAHLPSPTTLELKPLQIEPKVRNRAETPKPIIESDRILPRKLKSAIPLFNPLDRISTLDDLRNSVHSNANSALPKLNSLTENIHSPDIEDVAKNIRLNTEKTLKGIQRRMKSASKKHKKQNPFGNSFALPQDFLDDMNDKLKGIHYDLNDRLASLRESILDSHRLKNLVEQPHKAANRNVMTNFRKPKTKSVPTRLKTASSTSMAETIGPEKYTKHINDFKPRKYFNENLNKLRETQNAASAPAPTITEMPKMSMDQPFSYLYRTPPSLRESPVKTEVPRERMAASFLHRDETQDRNMKKHFFKPVMNSLMSQRQPKVKISFGSTTPRTSIVPLEPGIRVPNMSESHFEDFPSFIPGNTDETVKLTQGANGKTLSVKPLRTSAPIPSPFDEDYEDTLNNFSSEETLSRDIKFEPPILREKSRAKVPLDSSNKYNFEHIIDDRIDNLIRKSSAKTLNSPGFVENLPSSNMQHSVNFRKLNSNQSPVKVVKNEQLDMIRSPTENKDLVVDEPLKENVSYRCRMICTKEIR